MNEESKRPLLTLAVFGLLFGGGLLILQLVSPGEQIAEASPEQAGEEPEARAEAEAEPPSPDEADSLVLTTDDFRAEWTAAGGGLRSLVLEKERFAVEGEKAELVTTDQPVYLPFRQIVEGASLPSVPTYEVESRGPKEGLLRLRGDGLLVSRKLEAKDGYRIFSTTRVQNLGDAPRTHHPKQPPRRNKTGVDTVLAFKRSWRQTAAAA